MTPGDTFARRVPPRSRAARFRPPARARADLHPIRDPMTDVARTRIEVMDTTLRDGEQTPEIAYTPEEKLQLAKLLISEVQVDRIEVAGTERLRFHGRPISQISHPPSARMAPSRSSARTVACFW